MVCCYTTHGFVETRANFFVLLFFLFCMINIQRRELYSVILYKYAFNIGILSDDHEPISFKLGLMLDMP